MLLFHQSIIDMASCLLFGLLKFTIQLRYIALNNNAFHHYVVHGQISMNENDVNTLLQLYDNITYRVLGFYYLFYCFHCLY